MALYRNGGPGTAKWIWYPVAEPIASGIDSNGYVVRFADLNGDGRDDYLKLTMGNAAVDMYFNGCSAQKPPTPSNPPAVPDDPIPPYGDGTVCHKTQYETVFDIPTEGMSQMCFLIHSLETYSKQLSEELEEFYEIMVDEWDRKFGVYAKLFAKAANESVMAFDREHAHEWHTCEVAERIYCCSNCEFVVEPDHVDRCRYCVKLGDEDDKPCRPDGPSSTPPFYFKNVPQACPPDFGGRGVGGEARQSVYWTLKRDQDWAELAAQAENATGVDASFIVPGNYKFFFDTSPGYQENCFRNPGDEYCVNQDWWYDAPLVSMDYAANDVANPKDLVMDSLPMWQKLPADIDGMVRDLRAGTFRIDGDRVDPALYPYIVSVPASLLNETLVSMRQIVKLVDDLEDNDLLEEIILNLVSLVGMLLPMAAPYVAVVGIGARASMMGRWVNNVATWTASGLTRGSHLTGWGIAIYQSIQDPATTPIQFFQQLLGGAMMVKLGALQMGRYISVNDAILYTSMGGALRSNHMQLYKVLPSVKEVKGIA